MSSSHVGVITYDWYPYEPRARRLAEAAVAGGYEVDVICLPQTGEKRYEVCSGVHVYRLPVRRNFGASLVILLTGWLRFLFLASITITRLHLKHAYSVIHVHNIPDFLVFSCIFPKLLGAKIILDVQDVSPELMVAKSKGRTGLLVKYLATWQERWSAAFANHVVTVGTPFEQLLLRRTVARDKLTVILNSTDPVLFPVSKRLSLHSESSADESCPFILMYHGTLAERNGLDIAIQAFALAMCAVPQLRFHIMGGGSYLPHLKELAEELEVSEHVVFTGPCPSEHVVDFVAHGNIGIIPYRCDGFMDLVLPTKAYEFAWMHRAMIVSDTPALRSIFRPESVAFCNPNDPESFAEVIIDLYQHPEKQARMIANAAMDYESYRWELMAERYQHLLASLINKRTSEKPSVTCVS